MDELDIIINSGSSIIQAFYEKKGSTLKDEYRRSAAIAFMDKKDMQKLDLKPHDKIDVTSKWGSVTLYVDKSHDSPHEGMIFIPKGPWANIVISPETYCCNIPTYKGIKGKIRKSQREVLLVADLMKIQYSKYSDDDVLTEKQLPVYKKRSKISHDRK